MELQTYSLKDENCNLKSENCSTSNLGLKPSEVVNEDNVCIYVDCDSDSLYGSFKRRENISSSNYVKSSDSDILLRIKTGETEFQSIKRYESILRPPLFQVFVSNPRNEPVEDKPRKASLVATLVDAFNQKSFDNNQNKDLVDAIFIDNRSSIVNRETRKICQELKENRNLKWIDTEQVRSQDFPKKMKKEEIKFQESQFELISSEASYNRSLAVLIDKFYNAPEMSLVEINGIKPMIKPYQKEHLFSNILKIYAVSSKFLADLEKRFCESVKITDLSDIVIKYAVKEFDVYIPYIQNQRFQSEAYNELKKDPDTMTIIEKLENQPECCSLTLDSFLLLPMQRLLRILMLLKSVKVNILVNQKSVFESVEKAIINVENIIRKCSEKKDLIDERQRMMQIIRYLEFKPGHKIKEQLGILIYEGEVKRGSKNPYKLFKAEFSKFKDFWFILTTEYLLMTKVSKSKDVSYVVDDYCRRSALVVDYDSIEENENTFEFKLQINRESKVCDAYLIQTKNKEVHKKWIHVLSDS